MRHDRLDHDVSHCQTCGTTVPRPRGTRPRVVEFCADCAAPPDDETTAEHYWAIGGSDDHPHP